MNALTAAQEISDLFVKCLEDSGVEIPLDCIPSNEDIAAVINKHLAT